MKQMMFFLGTTLMSLVISCNTAGTSSDTSTSVPMTTSVDEENKRMTEKNEQVYRAIETGNFNGIDTILANDVVDHSTPTGKELKGKDSIIASLKGYSAAFKNLKIETKASSFDREKGIIFSLVRTTGTSSTEMNGIAANTPIDMTSVDVVKVTDGKITEHWGFENPAETIKMMGKQTTAKQ